MLVVPQLACAAAATKQPVLNAERLVGRPPAQPPSRPLPQPNVTAHGPPQPHAHTAPPPRAHGAIAPQLHAAGATATGGSAVMNARAMFERGGVPPNAAPPTTPPRVSPPSVYLPPACLLPPARGSRATLAGSRRACLAPFAQLGQGRRFLCCGAGHQLAWRSERRYMQRRPCQVLWGSARRKSCRCFSPSTHACTARRQQSSARWSARPSTWRL